MRGYERMMNRTASFSLARHAVLRLLILCACLSAFPASSWARDDAGKSACYASGDLSLTFDKVARVASAWVCDGSDPDSAQTRIIVRYDPAAIAEKGDAVSWLKLSRINFDRMEVRTIGIQGGSVSAIHTYETLPVGPDYWTTFVKVPQLDEPLQEIVLTVDGSDYPQVYPTAELLSEAPMHPTAGLEQIVTAILCGLLIAPLFFDIGFFRALREPFPLFHAAFCFVAALQTAFIAGLVPQILSISWEAENIIGSFSFDLMLIATALFVRSFIEREHLARKWRTGLLMIVPLIAVMSILVTLNIGDFGNALTPFVYSSYAVYLTVLIGSIAAAWRHGSRSVRYVALAFAPLFTMGTLRVIGGLVPPLAIDFDEMWAQNFSLFFEVLVTSPAVTGRFLLLRRERDIAIDEARNLEAISERDVLTGLLNRRAIETRFPMLHASGFNAMAVIDLDHFKQVNDRYGHAVGDEVLVAAASALKSNDVDRSLGFRMGGEEFLLLLRGDDALERAELCRQQITRIIQQNTEVGRAVTASMGFVEATPGALASRDFQPLYERADRLLYEAKAAGRNRTVSERLRVFAPRGRAERRAA